MVQAGLSPMEAIQAATIRPTQLLTRTQDLGRVQAGARADLIAVAGDPSTEISKIRNVRLVIRDGRVWDERQ